MPELQPTRDLFPDMDITAEDLIGRSFSFEPPKTQEEKIVHFLVNGINQNALVRAWSERTKYPENSEFGPPVKYEYKAGDPSGQCGVTAMALGMAMVWRDVASPDKIFYEEGSLHNLKGELLGEHHVWLRIEGDEGQQWIVDVASHQYPDKISHPDEHISIVMQGSPKAVGHYYGINRRYDNTRPSKVTAHIPVPNALSLQYNVSEVDGKKCSTPLSEYDAALFEERLERFMYKYEQLLYFRTDPRTTIHLGLAATRMYRKNWYPRNYNHSQETWNPGESINLVFEHETALNFIKDSDYSTLELVKNSQHDTLAFWAHECATRVLPHFKKVRPEDNSLDQAAQELRLWIGKGRAYKEDIEVVATSCQKAIHKLQYFYPIAQLAGESMREAVLAAGHPSQAIHAATKALRAVYYADQSDNISGNKTAVLRELEWQHTRLKEIKEIFER